MGRIHDTDSIQNRQFFYSIPTMELKDNQNNSSIVSSIGCNEWKVIIYLDEKKSIAMRWMAVALVRQRL